MVRVSAEKIGKISYFFFEIDYIGKYKYIKRYSLFFYYSDVKKKEIRNNWMLTLLPQGMSRFSKKKLKEIKKK